MQWPSSQSNLIESVYGVGEIFENLNMNKRQIVGIWLAIFSGLVNEVALIPVIYVTQNEKNKTHFDHVFSYFSGALFTSFSCFIIYCLARKNKPVVHASLTLPGLFTGKNIKCLNYSERKWLIYKLYFKVYLMQLDVFFISWQLMPRLLSFRLASLPSAISIAIGFVYFKEVDTNIHLFILCTGFCVSIIGSILYGLSVYKLLCLKENFNKIN